MPSLLTAIDCTSHVHLIVGHNPLASSRASRSIELGAKVKLLAPADSALHYGLKQKIDDGLVEWIQKETVMREDLTTLGRDEVDGVVDAVFVTLRVGCAQGVYTCGFPCAWRGLANVAVRPADIEALQEAAHPH